MRDGIITAWLEQSDWRGWARAPLAGDASARRYERLTGPNGSQVILMDAPVETCGSQASFVAIATHLKKLGLCPPDILEWDEALGLLVLTDLGPTDVARHLTTAPQDEVAVYRAAAEVLARLSDTPAPSGLLRMTPNVGADMLAPAFDFAVTDIDPNLRVEIEHGINAALHAVSPSPQTLSLRDFHAENLIWRAELSGTNRIGLLDFQDAFVTHPAYDVASLLRDARRDVSADMIDDLLAIVMPKETHEGRRHAFHVLAVQRNLRILGIFHKLARQDGKIHYLSFVPRVWNYLVDDLSAPELANLKPAVLRAFEGTAAR